MTVINIMSFGNSGAAVADEQSSNALRKYNVAQKLHLLDGNVIYGGSGASDFINEIYEVANDRVKKVKEQNSSLCAKDVFDITTQTMGDMRNLKKDQLLRLGVGFGLDELTTGILARDGRPLSEEAKKFAGNILADFENNYALSLLLGGYINDQFRILNLSPRYGANLVSRPFDSIGSGADESDKVLSGFVTKLSREKRDEITPREGLVKLIEATNASSHLNVGVGGSPSILYSTPKEVKRPSENRCILASELVEGLTQDLLDRDFVYDAVLRVVNGEGDFEGVQEEMKARAKSWDKLDKVLRGYKQD